MAGDLSIAQDYETYLNNREAINALMAANPDSAFTAGWIATFARVNDLKLNQLSPNDFLGGLVGYLDSVAKAGLGSDAANVVFKQGAGISIEIKLPNGDEVPGALAVFASQVSQSSDAGGTTVRLAFTSFLTDSGFAGFAGQGGSGAYSGNVLWFGADVANSFSASASHNTILIGGASSDVLTGGNGFDFLDGGAGNDTLTGGAEPDPAKNRRMKAVCQRRRLAPCQRDDRHHALHSKKFRVIDDPVYKAHVTKIHSESVHDAARRQLVSLHGARRKFSCEGTQLKVAFDKNFCKSVCQKMPVR
jgi:RTX calcium-binding nonapeptide repeat (4 copies)